MWTCRVQQKYFQGNTVYVVHPVLFCGLPHKGGRKFGLYPEDEYRKVYQKISVQKNEIVNSRIVERGIWKVELYFSYAFPEFLSFAKALPLLHIADSG